MADLAQREKWNTLTDAAAKEVRNEKVLKILSKIERFDELRPTTLQPWLEDFENAIDMAQQC
uniref:Uncharacterized protein n=1 Tax=Moniliophthora roreri TaxID=221103 RepID=A0A0W0GAU1_MONRR